MLLTRSIGSAKRLIGGVQASADTEALVTRSVTCLV